MLRVEMVHGDKRLWAEEKDGHWNIRISEGDTVGCRELSHEDAGAKVAQFYKAFADEPHRFTIVLGDMVLVRPIGPEGNIVAFDMLTGRCHTAWMIIDEVCALLKLAIGGPEIEDAQECYDILYKLLQTWPNECRPVP